MEKNKGVDLKLSDNQFEKLINNVNQISFHEQKIQELRQMQNDMISLICEAKGIDCETVKRLDFESKSFVLNK